MLFFDLSAVNVSAVMTGQAQSYAADKGCKSLYFSGVKMRGHPRPDRSPRRNNREQADFETWLELFFLAQCIKKTHV
jgi:hypothetical protein